MMFWATVVLFVCVSASVAALPSHRHVKRSTVPPTTSPCFTMLAEVEAQIADANGMLVGLERPLCDAIGDFMGLQYKGSRAFCVAPDGTKIAGFEVNRWEAVDIMDMPNCQCARDQNAYQQTGLIGRIFSCDRFGNYAPTGCTGAVCFCQDRNGNPVGDTLVDIGQLDTLNC